MMSSIVFIVFLASLVASAPHQPQQQKEDADIVDFLKQFRSQEIVDASLRTTLTPSEVIEEVKIRTRRDAQPQDSTSDVQNRSICPWTYRVQTNPNRQPADLREAVCSAESPVQGSTNVCETIYYDVPIRVKKTSSSTGVVTWDDSWQKVAVGCTWAKRREAPAIPPNVTPTWS